MTKRFLLLFIVVINSLVLSAQNGCDCENEKKLDDKFTTFLDKQDLPGATKFIQSVQLEEPKPCQISILTKFLVLQNELRDSSGMLVTLKKAEALFTTNCTSELIHAKLLLGWSKYYLITEKYDSALAKSQLALTIAEDKKNLSLQAGILQNLFVIMSALNQPERAIGYQRRCVWVSEQSDDENTAVAYGNLGAAYGGMFDATGNQIYLDSLVLVLNKSTAYIRRKKTSPEQIGFNFINIAQVYMLKDEFKKGLDYCDSALSYTSMGNPAKISVFNIKYNIYAGMGDKKNALVYADSAYKCASKNGNTKTAVSTMQSLSEAYELNGDSGTALRIYKKMVHIRDSINKSDRIAAITAIEEKYNKTRNEKKISELNQAQEISSLNIKLLTAGIIGSLLIIILVFIVFRQRSLKNKQTLLQTELKLNRARMDPHFFFNTLGALQTYALKEKDPVKLADLLSMYSKIMRYTLESTFTDLIKLENEIEYLEMYLKLQQFRNNGNFTYSIEVDDSVDASELQIPSMIIQPFVENAIEHGFSNLEKQGNLVIRFSEGNNMLNVQIKDNGAGFSTSSATRGHKSRATEITQSRLELLNAKYKSKARFDLQNNSADSGTTVNLRLPILY